MISKTTSSIPDAANILGKGGLVAFPTETVYGLGADARCESAIQRIFLVKERPMQHPLIVHIGRKEEVETWAEEIPPAAWQLMDRFWPGPLTVLLKKKASVSVLLTGGQPTVGLRMPNHPIALSLLKSFGRGVAGPSANKFTKVSPTTSAAVWDELGKDIDLILEGDACQVGLESTIIDLSQFPYKILRPGHITPSDIKACLNCEIDYGTSGKVLVPGMHKIHYAPNTHTTLIDPSEVKVLVDRAIQSHSPVCFLLLDPLEYKSNATITWQYMPRHPENYARALYRTLRQLDQQGYSHIFIQTPPQGEVWQAIHDRLIKSSAPR
ncbi:MAG: threonylcarbamoyl-AMP synthase [Gammaproteobacteria bacterium]|nr:threonylcarbamoyl-AMP synthase [Gammaproteobacteria bacterium]